MLAKLEYWLLTFAITTLATLSGVVLAVFFLAWLLKDAYRKVGSP